MSRTLFLGMGRMGAPMSKLHAERFETVVFDVSPDAAERAVKDSKTTAVASLSPLPDDVTTVILMLPTSKHVEGTLLGAGGLLEALPKEALVIDMSSSEPESTQRIADASKELSVRYVDAPVSGGIAKARSGELSIMVGGESDGVAAALPHLETMGSSIQHVGPAGAGHAAKALNNLVSATNMAAATEAVTIASRFGIEPSTMVAVLNSATGMSQATQVKFPNHILPGTFASAFAYDLMLKDMRIALEMARQIGFNPVTAAAFDALEEGRKGLGEQPDHTEIARVYEQRTGVEIHREDQE